MKTCFKKNVEKRGYNLQSHNCCHAVMEALIGTNFPNFKKALDLARQANATWMNIHGTLSTEDYIKKNI